jgi:hypothetical protein
MLVILQFQPPNPNYIDMQKTRISELQQVRRNKQIAHKLNSITSSLTLDVTPAK